MPSLGADRLAAIAYDGVVSHLSAAVAWNLPLLVRSEKPHITVPVKRRPRAGRPVVMHWAAVSSAERLSRLTSLQRTVVDCVRILPFGEALAIADAALATGRLSRDELEAAATAMRGPGRPTAVRVAAAATWHSESFLESMLRSLLLIEGIEGFEPQLLVDTGGAGCGSIWATGRRGSRWRPRDTSSMARPVTSPPTAGGMTTWSPPAGWYSDSPTSRFSEIRSG